MLQFRFRLEKLLELRRYEEEQWELKLAKVAGECQVLKKRIEENRARIQTGVQRDFTNANYLDVSRLVEGDLYIYRLYREIDALKIQLQKKEEERAEVAKIYLEHSRKRKVLDKLKERKAQEYYKTQRLEEFKVLDDINNSAESRKSVRG